MSTLGCQYEASHFGARYPDATCHEGYLWDLDSCDEPGGPLTHGGDTPCPWCNTAEHVEWMDRRFSGSARQRRAACRVLIAKVRAWAAERSSFPPDWPQRTALNTPAKPEAPQPPSTPF